jgi:multisubunit Na+/H+ antiporter MnhG subunit
MPWFLASSAVFAMWAVVFFLFPAFSNEFGGIGYVRSAHAEDWTQLVGVFSLAFAVLLYEAHRSPSSDVRRVVARGVLSLTVPSALLLTYWQIIPERRWIRLDIADIALLCLVTYGMYSHAVAQRTSRSGGPPNNELQRTRPAQATEPRR